MKRKQSFSPGDRIYTRVTLQGQQVGEFVFDCINGMSQLITALRYRTRQFRGLAKIYIRNMTSGWSIEQPLMLYPGRYSEEEMGIAAPSPTSPGFRRYMDM